MEKRLIVLLSIFILLFISQVNAEISIQGPEKTKVSLGEEIQVSGYVLKEKDTVGLFKFELSCNSKKIILIKSISLKANVKKEFVEKIAINDYLEGACTINAFLEVNKEKQDEASSSPFEITRGLIGDINLNSKEIKLGDEIEIDGIITKPEGTKIDGSMKIILRKGSTNYLEESVPITNGKFSFSYKSQDNLPGTYTLELIAKDAFNNEQVFTIENFRIQAEIDFIIDLEKREYLPEEKIKLTGTAKIAETNVKSGYLTIDFNDERYEARISRGSFKHTITLPEDIKSGEHIIYYQAEDDYGNRKTGELTISITPVPTLLEIVTNEETFKPNDEIKIKPTLYDQAGDIIQTQIELIIKNSKKQDALTETLESNTETTLILPQTAVPGSWQITASALEIETEKTLEILEVSNLELNLQKDILSITNTGNIQFRETLIIYLESPNEEKNRGMKAKLSIQPGETVTVDLAQGTEPGIYTVTVGDKTFKDVEILLTRSKPIPWVKIIIPLILVIILLYIFLKMKNKPIRMPKIRRRTHRVKKHKPVKKVRRYRSEEHHVEKFKRDMHERAESKKRPLIFKFNKKIKDEFIMELPKKREVDSYSEKRERYSYPEVDETPRYDPFEEPKKEEKPKDDEPKKGLFNMFD